MGKRSSRVVDLIDYDEYDPTELGLNTIKPAADVIPYSKRRIPWWKKFLARPLPELSTNGITINEDQFLAPKPAPSSTLNVGKFKKFFRRFIALIISIRFLPLQSLFFQPFMVVALLNSDYLIRILIMSPFKGKKFLKNLTTHLGLGCGCSSTNNSNNIAHVYEPKPILPIPKPKPKPKPKPRSSTFSSSNDRSETCTSTSSVVSSGPSNWHNCNQIIETMNASASASASRRWNNSCSSTSISTTAVLMDSENPYEDFQKSMLEMIMENQIYCADELFQLLHCFLRLNSPTHHHLILCAFFQVSQYAIVSSSISK
ncbi:transcription repressor OFP4 [Spinacia oleracea]|uniref:Transcription repressor n=1 Tax=Spinacia oleracea TaxID=3562 RepID=A0ABM3QQ10_SPIOL|nr:transcription repressor OFP4-like [Spinacia oleracea]